VTRYLEICRDVARRVADGDLPAGGELPGVRELALSYATTATTVSRAQRRLAGAGVLVLADRRRARVAADGRVAAGRFLHAERVLRLAGSDDPALDVLLRGLGSSVVLVPAAGSAAGLRAVAQGRADAAAIHLLHRDGTWNAPFARGLLRGLRPHLLHLWRREQGLIVPAGNPGGLASVADLAAVRVARRHHGTGTRVLLDRLLREAGRDPDAVRGPEVGSHLEVALAVATGVVDAGVGVRSAARELDLGFVPLVVEDYDVVLPGEAVDAAAPLVAALHDAATRAAVAALGGYDTAASGALTDLDAAGPVSSASPPRRSST
jgi:molybdate-binding protein